MVKVSNEIKLRSLVSHGAEVWQDGAWVPLSQIKLTAKRTPANMLAAARKAGIRCKCACGCGVVATYEQLQFDHAVARINGGGTEIRWIQPLRYDPCHKAKTRVDLKLRNKVRRIRQKFFGEGRPKSPWRWPSRSIPSRPLTGRPFQLYAIR